MRTLFDYLIPDQTKRKRRVVSAHGRHGVSAARALGDGSATLGYGTIRFDGSGTGEQRASQTGMETCQLQRFP
jgi:hypothetical protein